MTFRRWLSRFVWLLLLLIVAYFATIKVMITWLQASPQQVTALISHFTEVDLTYDALEIEQTWSGVQVRASNLQASLLSGRISAQRLDVDLNIWSPLWSSMAYGERLVLEQARIEWDMPAEQMQAFDVQKQLVWLSKLWKITSLSEVSIIGLSRDLHELNIQSLSLSRALRWTMLADVKLTYGAAFRASRWHLTGRFEDGFGRLAGGELIVQSAQDLNLSHLYTLFIPSKKHLLKLPDGEVNFNAHIVIAGQKLSKVQLDVAAERLVWLAGTPELPRQINARLSWRLDEIKQPFSSMAFSLDALQFNQQPVASFAPMQLKLVDRQLSAIAPKWALAPYSALLRHFVGPNMSRFEQVELRDFTFDLSLDTLRLAKAKATLQRFNWLSEDAGLLIEDLSVHYASDQLSLNFHQPVQFETPHTQQAYYSLKIDTPLQVSFDWLAHTWQLVPHTFYLNEIPVSLSAKGDFLGEIDAYLHSAVTQMQQVKSQLLPYGLMEPELIEWLQSALLSGEDIQSEAWIQGNLADFPFESGEGVLKAQARVKQASLRFHPDWPTVEQIDALVTFTPYNLLITSPRATVMGAKGRDIRVDIKHLNTADIAVEVSAIADTDLHNALAFVLASPLAKSLGLETFLAKQVKTQGNISVVLERVFVPVNGYENHPETVTGHIKLEPSAITLFDKIALHDVQGVLHFSEKGVNAKAIKASTLASQAEIDVVNQPNKKRVAIHVNANGTLPQVYGFSGALPWQAKIELPYVSAEQKSIDLTLNAHTEHLHSKWPAPLSTDDIRMGRVNASLRYEQTQAELAIDWPGLLKSVFILEAETEQGLSLKRGVIAFGKTITSVEMNDQHQAFNQGLRADIAIETLDIDAWLRQTQNLHKLFATSALTEKNVINWLPSTIQIANLRWLEQDYSALKIDWHSVKASSSLLIELLADFIKAEINYHAQAGVDIGVDYLHLQLPPRTEKETKQAGHNCELADKVTVWPSVRFSGKNLFLGQRLLDSLRFEVNDTSSQREINPLNFQFANRSGNGEAKYIWQKNTNTSELEAQIDSKNVQAFTDFLGIQRGFSGQQAQLSAKLNWNGALECFAPKHIQGPFSMRFDQGIIADIEPGIARLISLLSIDSIVRRLQLDMKDITMKGLEYESITIAGLLKNGVAKLKTLNLESSGLDVALEGNIGLIDRTFDLNAKITPALGSTLPTLAGILGVVNPVTGILTYLLAKHLPFINEDIVTYHYRVTGPWASPEVNASGGSFLFK